MGLIQDRDAYIIAREYNFIPVDPLKFECYLGDGDDATYQIADGTNIFNCLFLVDTDELKPP